MANALYAYGREGFLAGDIDWDADTIKDTLIDEGVYTPNLATDQDYADVTAGGRINESTAFGSKTVANGDADAADKTHTSVSGATVESITIWQDTTVESTSRLIANLDTGTGLPFTPNGGDATITWGTPIFTL